MRQMKILFMLLFLAIQSFFFDAQANANDSSSLNQNQSVFNKNQKFDKEGVELYQTNLDMKQYKKLGVGLMAGGATGVLSLNGEINLEPSEAAIIGIGVGPGYGAFNLGWKHNFEAYYLSPYTKVGYSKWYSSSKGDATDSAVLKRIYNESELRGGRFDVDFVAGSMGIEYNQLEGDLSGVNLFGEIVVMADFRKFTMIPTGAIGINYYY